MKVTIITAGTRGDVQPIVALGLGLEEAGHDVNVCTGRDFESFITEYGLRYSYMDDEVMNLAHTNRFRESIEKGSKLSRTLGYAREILKHYKASVRRMLDSEWEAVQGTDVIVYRPQATAGAHLAEKLGVPCFLLELSPLLIPTRAFPNYLMPDLKLGGWYNRASYRLFRLTTLPISMVTRSWRKEVLKLDGRGGGLRQKNGKPITVLSCISPQILPRPDDWPDSVRSTGFLFLKPRERFEPPPDLVKFLEAGPPPVYVGFGSMARNAEKVTRIVLGAIGKSGQRAVLSAGAGGLAASELPPNVFMIESVLHDWLFPHVSAVVHHGGAGTTAAGAYAGKPTVICPFFGDQGFWGRLMFEMGVGTEPIPVSALSVDRLGAAIRTAATDRGMRERAGALAERIRAEDGVAQAVRVIDSAA